MKPDSLPEIVCREVVELLTEYLSGALSPDDQTRINGHLEDCEPCTEYLAQLRATIARTAELRDGTKTEVSARLLESFRARKRGSSR